MESVGLGFSNLTLAVHSSETVNKISMAYLLANITMLAATMGINLWVVRVIQKKEKSRINRLNVWDCFANILTMTLMLLTHSPLLPLSSTRPCIVLVFFVYAMTWNWGGIKFEALLSGYGIFEREN